MKNLPIGLQTLPKLREKDCVYVDKTQMIHNLVKQGVYYFLSRPRRFGKSLLISTMKELFLGNKHLFQDTWIENNWDWSKTNPVIHFSFDKMSYQALGLEGAMIQEIKKFAASYKVNLVNKDVKSLFNELRSKNRTVDTLENLGASRFQISLSRHAWVFGAQGAPCRLGAGV